MSFFTHRGKSYLGDVKNQGKRGILTFNINLISLNFMIRVVINLLFMIVLINLMNMILLPPLIRNKKHFYKIKTYDLYNL